MGDGGKGSAPRPFSIAQDEYAKRWDAIFQRDLKDDNGTMERGTTPQTSQEESQEAVDQRGSTS